MRDVPLPVLLNSATVNDDDTKIENLGLVAINCAFAGLIIIASLLRIYTTAFIRRRVTSDDVYILLAVVVALGYNASVILANVKFYWNAELALGELLDLNKIAFATKLLYIASSFLVRTSLLCLYYRLQRKLNLSRYTWILHGTTVYSTAIFLTFIPLFVFECTPISAYWKDSGSGKCLHEGPITVAAAVCTCVAEVAITILAAPLVIRLRLPQRVRLLAVLLLILGIICTAAGISRTYFIWRSLLSPAPTLRSSFPRWICETVEIGIAVLCASATALHSLIFTSRKHWDFADEKIGWSRGSIGPSSHRGSFETVLPGSRDLRASSTSKNSIDYLSHVYRPEFLFTHANARVESKPNESSANGVNAPWVPPQYQPSDKSSRNSNNSSAKVKKLHSFSRNLRRAKSRTAAPGPDTSPQSAPADPQTNSSLPRLRALTPVSPLCSSFIDAAAAEAAPASAPIDSPTISLDRFLSSPSLHQDSFLSRPHADENDGDNDGTHTADLLFSTDWPLACPTGPGPCPTRAEPQTLCMVSSGFAELRPGAARVKSKVAVRGGSAFRNPPMSGLGIEEMPVLGHGGRG